MKKSITFLTLLFFQIITISQQNPNLDFYPLHIGNEWQYRVHLFYNNSNIDTTYFVTHKVLGDTTLPNGLTYKVLEHHNLTSPHYTSEPTLSYLYVDSSMANIYEYLEEFINTNPLGILTDSLACSAGDFFGDDRHCDSVIEQNIFGDNRITKNIFVAKPDISFNYSLSKGIGITRGRQTFTQGFGGGLDYDIVYAKVNGWEYGHKVDPIIKDPLEYYPLHIGDFWQYNVTKIDGDTTKWIGMKEVIGDTLLSNGHKYFVIQENSMPAIYLTQFVRIDSSTNIIYSLRGDEEQIFDKLGLSPGGYIDQPMGYQFTKHLIDTILGLETFTRSIEEVLISSTDYNGWNLSKGFGETYRYYIDMTVTVVPYEANLVYAKINGKEYGTIVGVEEKNENTPSQIHLSQNYPNPFNPVTRIEYSIGRKSIGEKQEIQLKVFDLLGREIAVLVNQHQSAGSYSIDFDGSNLPSGVYLYKLNVGNFSETKKMVLLK